jgi:hypothetical protein
MEGWREERKDENLQGHVVGDVRVPHAQEKEGEGREEDVVKLDGSLCEIFLPRKSVAVESREVNGAW